MIEGREASTFSASSGVVADGWSYSGGASNLTHRARSPTPAPGDVAGSGLRGTLDSRAAVAGTTAPGPRDVLTDRPVLKRNRAPDRGPPQVAPRAPPAFRLRPGGRHNRSRGFLLPSPQSKTRASVKARPVEGRGGPTDCRSGGATVDRRTGPATRRSPNPNRPDVRDRPGL